MMEREGVAETPDLILGRVPHSLNHWFTADVLRWALEAITHHPCEEGTRVHGLPVMEGRGDVIWRLGEFQPRR